MRDEYTEILEAIEAEIGKLLPTEPDEAWFGRIFGELPSPPPAEIRAALNAPALELLRRGGKRWRPLLLVLAARAHGRSDGALALAPLVEIAHDGTLIVDDIEDGADTRRGGPAIHLMYGVDAAVNAGNLLYFLPLVLIDELPAEPALRGLLHARYALHLRRLHLGQAMDIGWHRARDFIPALRDYLAMCALKTGVLARASAEFGALVAGAPLAEAEALGAAFEEAGVAFQILDDVKNLRTGNPGKKRGDDIVEGKKSLPVILAVESDHRLARELPRCFDGARAGGPEAPEVEEAIGMIARTGALEAAEGRARALLGSAESRVQAALGPRGEDLLGIFPLLLGR